MNTSFSRFTLLFIIVIDAMGLGVVYPALAYYFLENTNGLFSDASVQLRIFYLGLIFAIYPCFMAIGSLKIGKLSDHLGRKKALLICLSGFCLGFLITTLGIVFANIWLIALGRAVAGSTAGSHVIAQASMADISSGIARAKNISAVVMANMLGFVIGPAFGGVLSSSDILSFFTTYTPFMAMIVLGLVCIVLTFIYFKETFKVTEKSNPESVHVTDFKLLTRPFLLQLIGIYFLFTIGWNFFFQFAPVYLEDYFRATSSAAGGFMSFVALIFMLTIGLIVRPLLTHISLKSSLVLGLFMLFISMLFIMKMSTLFWFWIAVVPLCVGAGFTYTASLSLFSNSASEHHQGHIMGVASVVKSTAWTLAPIVSGMIAYFNIAWPMYGAMLCFLLGLLLCWRLSPK